MKEITDRRYPIGKFEYGKSFSNEDTRKHIKIISRLPKEIKKTLKKLKDGALDKPYRTGGWTARQVIHHLADSHVNAYIRCKLAATEKAPIIKPYEEKAWAELEDAKHGSAKISLKLLSALHARWVDFLTSLSNDDLELGYYHPANKRTVSLREAIALYAWHSQHHLAHIQLVAAGNFDKSGKKEDKKEKLPAAEKPKRARRSSAEVAAEKAAKAAAPKLSRAEVLAKARAARQAKPAAPKAAVAEKPKRARRSSAEVAAEKAAKAAAPKMSRAEVLAKARAARQAKTVAKPKKDPNAPKLSKQEIMAKARAARKSKK
ncbi:MAG: putative metal-dependent hydrolase [Saprospiraceae bacterium]|nr:putative metal-dependent hydrolase [Saprospiraceae bacterium]